jgi:hypothetical protein
MLKFITGILCFLLYLDASGQSFISFFDSVALSHIPGLTIQEEQLRKDLPFEVDNSIHPYLRPVFTQDGASCGQAAAIGYLFTYEIDRKRDVPANLPQNQYPTHFTWNFMNSGDDGDYSYGTGVSYFHSFSILKELGCPSVSDYGGMWMRGDSTRWMTGYDLYYRSMKNRIEGLYAIDVSTPEGLDILKHWIHDHLDGSEVGGAANFYAGIIYAHELPAGTPDAGHAVMTSWASVATHAMTVVGYNDSIRFDYNGDGIFTNDLDIDHDGSVTMKDWEIGGLKFVNSYGPDWGTSGFCYMMYRTLAKNYGEGGIWNNTMHIIRIRDPYTPLITMEVTLMHDSREKIKVTAGVSTDTLLLLPVHTLEFPVFNHQGGDLYMQGGKEEEDKTIEFGLDITPLLSYAIPGKPARFFLIVDENDPASEGTGEILDYAVIDYSSGISEIHSLDTPCPIHENDRTVVSVVKEIAGDKIMISDETIPAFVPGQSYIHQLTAAGGTPPYTWHDHLDYLSKPLQEAYPSFSGEELFPNLYKNDCAMKVLDFPFPFFGSYYDTLYVFSTGCIMFHSQSHPWPYIHEMGLYLESNRLIAPFTSESLIRRPANGDGIWYEGTGEYGLLRWHLTDGDHITSSFDFSLKLYPDGIIEFYYDTFQGLENLEWVAGFSNGDSENFILTAEGKKQSSPEPSPVRYLPSHLPPGLTLSESGLLHGIPGETDQITDLRISATDYNRITSTKQLQLTSSLLVNPSIHAGNDSLISRNEQVIIDLDIRNHGPVPLDSIEISVSTDDTLIVVMYRDSFCNRLLPGEAWAVPNAIELVAGTETPDLHPFILDLQFRHDIGKMTKKLIMNTVAPVLRLGDITVDDGGDQRLDPGETADLLIKVNNEGHDGARSVSAAVLCMDPYLSINEDPVLDFYDIPSLNFRSGTLNVTAHPSTPNGHLAELVVHIQDSSGAAVTNPAYLKIGTTPVLIIDLDKKLNSGPVIRESMDSCGVYADYVTYMPWWDLHKYRAIFLCLGVFPFNFELNKEDGAHLADYLLGGGNLYMEGSTTWVLDDQTAVHELFGLQGKSQAWTTGIDTLQGEVGTFTENMEFPYTGENTRMDNLMPVETAYSIFHEKTTDYSFAVANPGETYNTVGTSFELGGLRDTLFPSLKRILLRNILDFFGVAVEVIAANFMADHSQISTHQSIVFKNLSTKDVTNWQWEFPGGDPDFSFETNPRVTYDSAGIFNVSLTVSNGTETNTLLKNNYIVVRSAIGIAGISQKGMIRCYPNPSPGLFYIETPELASPFDLQIFDQLGRCLHTSGLQYEKKHYFDLRHLSSGIYWMVIKESHYIHTGKILIFH